MVPVLGPDGKTVYQKIATSSLSSFSLLTEAKQRMAEDLKKKKEEEEERERVDMLERGGSRQGGGRGCAGQGGAGRGGQEGG